MRNKVQTIKFNEFLSGDYKVKDVPRKTMKAYSFVGVPINITAFFDPTIITIGSVVMLLVVAEKLLAHYGLVDVLAKVELTTTFLFPVLVFSFLLYVLAHI